MSDYRRIVLAVDLTEESTIVAELATLAGAEVVVSVPALVTVNEKTAVSPSSTASR